jgi:acetyltransferase-like isoleucine patch superfamily enzyme
MFERINWGEYGPRLKLGPFKQMFRKICQLKGRFIFFNNLRIFFYRLMGMKIGRNVYIGYDCFLDSDFAELVTIEDEAVVSFRVIIVAHDWSRRMVSKVLIKKGAFIGAGAIIMPGVTIGENAVIGAGAVISHDIPDGKTYIGNPAKEYIKADK